MKIELIPQSVLTPHGQWYVVLRKTNTLFLVTKPLTQDTPFLLIVFFKGAVWDHGKRIFWLWNSGPIAVPGVLYNKNKSFPWGNGYIGLAG